MDDRTKAVLGDLIRASKAIELKWASQTGKTTTELRPFIACLRKAHLAAKVQLELITDATFFLD